MVDPLRGQMRFEIARTDVYSCGYDAFDMNVSIFSCFKIFKNKLA